MRQIVLASASPRRKELLEQIGLTFQIIPSKGEEIITRTVPAEVVEELSSQKAEEVADHIAEGIVIGADTIVCQGGEIMGKPKDREDAARMLRRIQGTSHSVFTGVTIILKDGSLQKCETFSCETKVYVYPMTEADIESYLNTGEPMDKAGAYGIQGKFAAWVKGIEGDYNNVVGLPVSAVWQHLKNIMNNCG